MSLRLAATLLFIAAIHSDSFASEETTCSDRKIVIDLGGDASPSRAQVFADQSLYMLNGLSPNKSCEIQSVLTIFCRQLDESICPLLQAATTDLEYDTLRDFYQQNQLTTVPVRGHEKYIKPTLAEFIAVTNYTTWQRTVVPRSNIKGKTRVIFRSPAQFSHEISVSETRNTETGDLRAETLEIEVAIRRNGSGRNYEFYTYSQAGILTDHSIFPAGERPSPTICVACHYNPAQRTVSRFIPVR